MQPALPPLPELNHFRYNPQPSPELRYWDISRSLKPPFNIPHPLLQHLPTPFLLRQHLTLLARPRPNPRPPSPQLVISLTLGATQPLHPPLNPNLPLHLVPPERQARFRIALHICRFAARAPVAVDDEAGGVEFFQVHVATGDGAGGEVGGGEADGFGLVDVGGLGGGEPGVELGEGGGGELGAFQGAFCVLVCLLGGFVAGRRNLDPRISMVLEGCEVGVWVWLQMSLEVGFAAAMRVYLRQWTGESLIWNQIVDTAVG